MNKSNRAVEMPRKHYIGNGKTRIIALYTELT